MKALFDSLVRTYVPWLVGAAIGWLVSLGVPLDPEVETQITLVLMGSASILYYAAARIFELYVSPKLGWLVGLPKQPIYDGQTKDQILAAHAELDDDEKFADEQAALIRTGKR